MENLHSDYASLLETRASWLERVGRIYTKSGLQTDDTSAEEFSVQIVAGPLFSSKQFFRANLIEEVEHDHSKNKFK